MRCAVRMKREDELLAALQDCTEHVKRLRAEVATMRAATDELNATFARIAASPYFASVALAHEEQGGRS